MRFLGRMVSGPPESREVTYPEGYMPPPSSLPNGQPAVRRFAPQPNGISNPAGPSQAYPTAPTPKGDSPLLGPVQIGTPRTPQINGNGTPNANQRGSRKRTADGIAAKEGGAKVSLLKLCQ